MTECDIPLGSLLACPQCRGALEPLENGDFRCASCDARFRAKNGVPRFLPEDAGELQELASREGSSMVRGYRRPSRFVNWARNVVSSEYFPGKEWRRAKQQVLSVRGPKLIIGSGVTRYPGSVHLDLDDFPGVDVIADAQALPFQTECLEGVCCEVVLEHVRHPSAVIAEAHRVLQPGGWAFFILPFVFPYHGHPGDYRRWSRQGIEAEFADFDIVKSGIHGGPCSAMVNLISEWCYVLSGRTYPRGYLAIKGGATALFFPLKYLDLLANRLPEAHRLAATFYVLAGKAGGPAS